MWIGIMILCGTLHAESCMVITTRELFPNAQMCFEHSIEKANKALTFPNVMRAKPYCQVIPGTQKEGEIDT